MIDTETNERGMSIHCSISLTSENWELVFHDRYKSFVNGIGYKGVDFLTINKKINDVTIAKVWDTGYVRIISASIWRTTKLFDVLEGTVLLKWIEEKGMRAVAVANIGV